MAEILKIANEANKIQSRLVDEDDDSHIDWTLVATGRTRARKAAGRGIGTLPYFAEYQCQDCGHKGWSCHPTMTTLLSRRNPITTGIHLLLVDIRSPVFIELRADQATIFDLMAGQGSPIDHVLEGLFVSTG